MLPYQTRVFNSMLSVAQARARLLDAIALALGVLMLFVGFAVEAHTAATFMEAVFTPHDAAVS